MSNATDIDYILDSIYSWIASRSVVDSQKIFKEDPNIDRPTPPSVSFRILSGPSVLGTSDTHKYDPAEGGDVVSGHRSVTISLKAYGEQSHQIMSNLQASLELISVREYFTTRNMAVWIVNPVLEISTVIETGIEDRHQLDITFGVSSIQTDDEGEITTINIKDATVVKEDGTVVDTINKTIDKP